MTYRVPIWMVLGSLLLTVGGCGTVEPESGEQLVVEAFVRTGDELPEVVVRRTTGLRSDEISNLPADDASVVVSVGGEVVDYEATGSGRYAPSRSVRPAAGSPLSLDVSRGGASVRGMSAAPPIIRVDSIDVRVPDDPVEAVLLDTLTLAPDADITGFVYLVDVAVYWRADDVDDDTFVRVQLQPDSSFASRVIDLFLRADQVVREATVERRAAGIRRWNGVYAVRVTSADAPLPSHRLRVGLLRSGRDYARFALSRDAPDRREPVGNLDGGLGIFAGISLDTQYVVVESR